VGTLRGKVDATTSQQQDILRRRQDTEKAIRDRHNTALAKESAAMATANEKEEAEIGACLKQQQDGLNSLLQLQQQVERAVATGSGNDVMVIAKEMNSGCGSVKAVRKLTSLKTPSFNMRRIPSMHNIKPRWFVGLFMAFLVLLVAAVLYTQAVHSSEDVAENEVIVTHKFNSGRDENTRVNALAQCEDILFLMNITIRQSLLQLDSLLTMESWCPHLGTLVRYLFCVMMGESIILCKMLCIRLPSQEKTSLYCAK
jgi:hypothetical protein